MVIKNFSRLTYINYILVKNGLDEIVLSVPYFKPIKFLLYLTPWYWFRSHYLSRGERIRVCLEQLGPIFIKFGQMLSTRQDLLPEDIIFELSKLQDNVKPFPTALAVTIIEQALHGKINKLFAEFNQECLASASIAQVYAAKLFDGKDVVIKVLRPNIEVLINKDLSLLKSLANLLDRYWLLSKRFKPIEVVAEFEKSLINELDLMREAANAVQLRRNFLHSPLLYIPEIYWPYARRQVLVMERVYGVSITNTLELNAKQVNLKKLAERGVEIFFTQVFRDRFFHADMHPGNIFIDVTEPENPRYIAVDFGIIGSLGPEDQRYLAENLLAFFKRDYRKVAVLHLQSGWVAANTRVDEFEAAIRCVCEPVFEKPLRDISFGSLLLRLFQVARSFNIEVQPQLILLQKTLLNIEGLGRQLYPELDLWQTAKPYLEKWIKEHYSVKRLLQQFKSQLPTMIDTLPEMPILIYETLKNHRIPQPQIAVPVVAEHSSKKQFFKGIATAALIFIIINLSLLEFSQIDKITALISSGLATILLIVSLLLVVLL